jgi:hypothetical protein
MVTVQEAVGASARLQLEVVRKGHWLVRRRMVMPVRPVLVRVRDLEEDWPELT